MGKTSSPFRWSAGCINVLRNDRLMMVRMLLFRFLGFTTMPPAGSGKLAEMSDFVETCRMRRGASLLALATLLVSSTAAAGNSDEVNAGVDVTLTGGAVVANVSTGASLWYNPAGLARYDKASFELTGVTFKVSAVKAPGLLTLETGEQSSDRRVDISVIPEAITFTIPLKKLRFGIGLFNSSIRRELVQEEALHPGDASSMPPTPSASWNAGANTRVDHFHVSAGIANPFDKRKQKALVGGAFDIVVSTARIDRLISGFYAGGAEGALSRTELSNTAGLGVQVKGGVQWMPIPDLRLGFSLSTPSYMVMLAERLTANELEVPPGASPVDPTGTNTRTRKISGGWFGTEPGTMRLGIAYVGNWGWIEGDFVVDFKLRSSRFLVNQKTVPNGKIGVVINVHKFIKLGLGAFTDLSQTEQLLVVGDRQIDFFGGNFGVLFTNKDSKNGSPETSADGGKPLVAVAIGVRYSHGRGDLLGLLLPPSYDPDAIQTRPVNTKINDADINFGVKVVF